MFVLALALGWVLFNSDEINKNKNKEDEMKQLSCTKKG